MPDQNNNNEFEEQKEEVEKVETSGVESTKEDSDDDYEKICFICRRPESVAGKMIELPNHLCVQRLHAEEF